MPSSRRGSLDTAQAIVVVADLLARDGCELTNGMARMERSVAEGVRLARLLRCRYLVVMKDMEGGQCHCVPCAARCDMRDGVHHAYLLASRQAQRISFLVMPESLGADVYTQAAVTRASRIGTPPRKGAKS